MFVCVVDSELRQHERDGRLCAAALLVNPGEHGT